MLAVESLNKNYGQLRAVRDLSFRIERGEIFGLLGPNGAGKTTTVECILGTKTADSGRISLMGCDDDRYPGSLFEKVGAQFQDSHYPDRIRVGELVEMTESLYRDAVGNGSRLLSEFGLKNRTGQAVSKLSGGEKQKLSVALALIRSCGEERGVGNSGKPQGRRADSSAYFTLHG